MCCVLTLAAHSQTDSLNGFYHRSGVGVLAGTSSNLSFTMSNGIRMKNGWENGFGFGIERYYGVYCAPLFVESRVNFLRNKIANTEFFTGIMGGYQSVLGNYRKGEGYTGGISVGMTHYVTKHAAIYTSLGYRYVWLKSDYNYYPYAMMDLIYYPGYYETSEIHRIELRVGLRFH